MSVIEIVMAESPGRSLDPALSSFGTYFPDAVFTLIEDRASPFDPAHPRYGWRNNDYFKVRGLLESGCDVAIATDADMKIVSGRVRDIIPLARRFGLCVPSNSRWLVGIDAGIGADGDKLERPIANGYAFNMSPIAFHTSHMQARGLLETYLVLLATHPARGPLVLWRAAWETGFSPCLLPPQWCVCTPDVGIGNEIILHVGNNKVKDHYVARTIQR